VSLVHVTMSPGTATFTHGFRQPTSTSRPLQTPNSYSGAHFLARNSTCNKISESIWFLAEIRVRLRVRFKCRSSKAKVDVVAAFFPAWTENGASRLPYLLQNGTQYPKPTKQYNDFPLYFLSTFCLSASYFSQVQKTSDLGIYIYPDFLM